MRTIIAGSRDITDYEKLKSVITNSGFSITTVISGTARGVDALGERWAFENKIPIERYPADWDTFGKSAGYRRNEQMASVADACIVLTNGSNGSKHMIDIAQNKKLKLYVEVYK